MQEHFSQDNSTRPQTADVNVLQCNPPAMSTLHKHGHGQVSAGRCAPTLSGCLSLSVCVCALRKGVGCWSQCTHTRCVLMKPLQTRPHTLVRLPPAHWQMHGGSHGAGCLAEQPHAAATGWVPRGGHAGGSIKKKRDHARPLPTRANQILQADTHPAVHQVSVLPLLLLLHRKNLKTRQAAAHKEDAAHSQVAPCCSMHIASLATMMTDLVTVLNTGIAERLLSAPQGAAVAVLLGATAAVVLATVVPLPGGGVSSSQGTLRVALGGSCTHFGGVTDAGLTGFPAAAAAAAVAAFALAALSIWQSVRLEPWHMHTLGGAPGPGIRFRTQPQKPLVLQHSASEEQGVHMARHSAALAGAATATSSSSRLPSSSPCGTAAIGAHHGDIEARYHMMLLPLRLLVACAARRGGC